MFFIVESLTSLQLKSIDLNMIAFGLNFLRGKYIFLFSFII